MFCQSLILLCFITFAHTIELHKTSILDNDVPTVLSFLKRRFNLDLSKLQMEADKSTDEIKINPLDRLSKTNSKNDLSKVAEINDGISDKNTIKTFPAKYIPNQLNFRRYLQRKLAHSRNDYSSEELKRKEARWRKRYPLKLKRKLNTERKRFKIVDNAKKARESSESKSNDNSKDTSDDTKELKHAKTRQNKYKSSESETQETNEFKHTKPRQHNYRSSESNSGSGDTSSNEIKPKLVRNKNYNKKPKMYDTSSNKIKSKVTTNTRNSRKPNYETSESNTDSDETMRHENTLTSRSDDDDDEVNDDHEFYLQGNHLIKTRRYGDSLRRRLPYFLPKRYHWRPEDIKDLGYYWFNGPKGRYPGPKNLIY